MTIGASQLFALLLLVATLGVEGFPYYMILDNAVVKCEYNEDDTDSCVTIITETEPADSIWDSGSPQSLNLDLQDDGSLVSMSIGLDTGAIAVYSYDDNGNYDESSSGLVTAGVSLGISGLQRHLESSGDLRNFYAIAATSSPWSCSYESCESTVASATLADCRFSFFLDAPDDDEPDVWCATEAETSKILKCPFSSGSCTEFGTAGYDDDEYQEPRSIAPEYAADGTLTGYAVADYANHRVQSCPITGVGCTVVIGKTNPDGTPFPAQVARDMNALIYPTHVAIEREYAFGPTVAYWIVDNNTYRVLRCDTTGECTRRHWEHEVSHSGLQIAPVDSDLYASTKTSSTHTSTTTSTTSTSTTFTVSSTVSTSTSSTTSTTTRTTSTTSTTSLSSTTSITTTGTLTISSTTSTSTSTATVTSTSTLTRTVSTSTTTTATMTTATTTTSSTSSTSSTVTDVGSTDAADSSTDASSDSSGGDSTSDSSTSDDGASDDSTSSDDASDASSDDSSSDTGDAGDTSDTSDTSSSSGSTSSSDSTDSSDTTSSDDSTEDTGTTYYVSDARAGIVYKCVLEDDACEVFLDESIVTGFIPSLTVFYPGALFLDTKANGASRGLLVGTTYGELIYCDMAPTACQLVTTLSGSDYLTGLGVVLDSGHNVAQFLLAAQDLGAGPVDPDEGIWSIFGPWSLVQGPFFMVSPDSATSDIIACTSRGRVERCPFDADGQISDCTTLVSDECSGISPEYDADGALSGFVATFGNQLQSCALDGTSCEVLDGKANGKSGKKIGHLKNPGAVVVEREAGTRGETVAYWTSDYGNKRIKRCEVGGSTCTVVYSSAANGLALAATPTATDEVVSTASSSVETGSVTSQIEVSLEDGDDLEAALEPAGESETWFDIEDTFASTTGLDGWTLESATDVTEDETGRRLGAAATYALTFRSRYVLGSKTPPSVDEMLAAAVANFSAELNERVSNGTWTVTGTTFVAVQDDDTLEAAAAGEKPAWATIVVSNGTNGTSGTTANPTSTLKTDFEYDSASSPWERTTAFLVIVVPALVLVVVAAFPLAG